MTDVFSIEGLLDHPERPHPVPRPDPLMLMIEDDQMIGRFVSHAAGECGYRFMRTSDFDNFVQMFRQTEPDVVSVDLHIPGCDGIEIMRFLASQDYDGRVIICSGLDHRVLESAWRFGDALGLNMATPLAKPFRFEELAQRLIDPVADPC